MPHELSDTRRRTERESHGVIGGFRRRRHGANVPFDRSELERSGWRTTLDYRENHVRRRGGLLDHVEEIWHAEAERICSDGSVLVVAATAHSASAAWSRLRREADVANCPAPPDRSHDEGVRDGRGGSRRSSPDGWRRHAATG